MPRIRTLKPEHRQHRKVGPLSDRTYRLWVGMILEADDDGRLVCDAAQLRALVFAYHPKVPIAAIEASLAALETSGLIRLYTVGASRYADFPSWADHQRIDHKMRSKLPEYQHSTNDTGMLASDPRTLSPEGKGRDQGLEGKGTHTAAAPLASVPPPCFDDFWEAWPPHRRVKKADAMTAWRTLAPAPALCQVILAALEAQKQRPEWQREGGRYIPHPHRWLGKRRWEDAPPAAQATLLTPKTEGNQAAAAAFLRRMGAT